MAVTHETKAIVEAELAMGVSALELSKKYSVPYVTVASWSKRLKDARNGDIVKDLATVSPETLTIVAEAVKSSAPPKIAAEIDKLVEGVTGLKTLEPKFHSVTLTLLTKAEAFARKDDLTLVEWTMISSAIGKLYNDIFSKGGVSVNVNNNTQINNEKLSMFKSSLRDS